MNIKFLRIEERKNPEDLAKMLGISVQAYYRYETGKAEPNIERLIKLADYYNVSIDYLVNREFNNQVYLSEQEHALIESFKNLSEVNKIKVVSYALGVLSTQE